MQQQECIPLYTGTEVGLVRAHGLPQETIIYGLEEDREEWEGVFDIDTSSGELSVGANGPNILIIVCIFHIMKYFT